MADIRRRQTADIGVRGEHWCLLLGSGKQARFVQVETVRQLADSDVKALIAAAVANSTVPLPSKGKGALIIKSSAAKRRPRRKPAS
jgi:hypothetical protein